MKKYYYTYILRTKNWRNKEIYYIGSRSSNIPPENDIHYLSSSKLVSHMRGYGIEFSKEILCEYPTRQDALMEEQKFFDEFGCIQDKFCINIHSFNNPYEYGRAKDKMLFFKHLFPELEVTSSSIDQFNQIKFRDLHFRVGNFNHGWRFINHPDRIKDYYPTTGTFTYWPGRADKLLSTKGGKKYYQTDLTYLDGTPMEQIEELFANHFVKGQRTHILETTVELYKKLSMDDEKTKAKELFYIHSKTVGDYGHGIFNRIRSRIERRNI